MLPHEKQEKPQSVGISVGGKSNIIEDNTIVGCEKAIDVHGAGNIVKHNNILKYITLPFWGNNKEKSWQNNILLYVFVGVIIILIASYLSRSLWGNNTDKNNPKPKVKLERSSISKSNIIVDAPNSVNIVGDNNVVNKVDIPKPQFKGTIESQSMVKEDLYQTKIILDITSQVPLQRIIIGAIDPDVLSIKARKNSNLSMMQGIVERAGEGRASVEFENAFGSYILTINMKKPIPDLLSKIKIAYQ
jgi:hypothetical protein